jgi:signal transduction histidine kinase
MKNLYSFLESHFGYLLVTDEDGRILHTSQSAGEDLFAGVRLTENTMLRDIVTSASWDTFRSAMQHSLGEKRGLAVFMPRNENATSVPLRAGYFSDEESGQFIFFGDTLKTLDSDQETPKDGDCKKKLSLMQQEEAESCHQLIELTRKIDEQKKELHNLQKRLSVVDSYLGRATAGWEPAKDRLETIFKAIPDEVVLLDTNRKVVMTNREGVQPGESCYAAFFGRESPCEDCRLIKILKTKLPVTASLKDGDRYFQVHSMPVFSKEHEVEGIFSFYRDVTFEKTYEQQLQQADKLASIGELVSGIGHEINNPNQFIRGNIKIVKQALEDMLPIVEDYYKAHPDLKIARLHYPFFREHVMVLMNDMAHGSERIKEIVRSLRAFTMRDEGLLEDTVEINTLVADTIRLVYKEVHKRSEIECTLGEHLPTFKGNAQKVEQVLLNLIINASQAIPDGRKGCIAVKTFAENTHIIIQIADNGCGMNQKTMKQIFDPFFTTRRAKGGTGLGLPIAFRLVEEHGGTLSVRSEPDKGTTFTIKIPAQLSS